MMNRILNLLRSLDWRLLLAVPVLSVLLGVANNMRLPEDQRVRWSGERGEDTTDGISSVVKPGAWTSNFDVATNKAASAHVPVVVVVTVKGCRLCSRLRKTLTGAGVKAWQKERGWYYVLVDRTQSERAYKLTRDKPSLNDMAPYVGVYWSRADGTTTMQNFPGRQGLMGVKGENTFALEWILAVEASVPGAPGLEDGVAASSIVQEAKIRITTAVDGRNGAEGRVKMVPWVDFVTEGKPVTLTAEPKNGSVFAGWRYPDGRFVPEQARLTVGTHFQGGTYTAVFRRPEHCAAPVLQLPETDLAWTEGAYEELKLRVNEDAYPVLFSCKGLPPGVTLPSRTAGVILGWPRTNGVWHVEVVAEGLWRAVPTATTGSFTVRVAPRARPANDGEKTDDEDEVH